MEKAVTKRIMRGLGFTLASFAILLWFAPAAMATGQGYGPGRIGLEILAGRDHTLVGTGGIWNSRDKLHIQLDPAEGWRIKDYYVDLGGGEAYSPPLTTTGNPKIGHFDYKETFTNPYINPEADPENAFRRTLALDLEEDLGIQWGSPFADLRVQGVAIFMHLVRVDGDGTVVEQASAWAVPELIVWEETAVDEEVDTVEVVALEDTGELREIDVVKVVDARKGRVRQVEHQRAQRGWEVEELEEVVTFEGGRWGWWFRYEVTHPRVGHFIDSPVAGLTIETPTFEGVTDVTAAFDYFPGETVEVSLGSYVLGETVADQKISPLDFFSTGDTDDHRVINMAMLLQSLDYDGDAQGGITITPETVAAFEQSMDYWGLTELDFSNDLEISNLIDRTIEIASEEDGAQNMTRVGYDEAKGHLEDTLNNVMFRKNVSKTPELVSTKAKMNIATMWFDARRADNTLLTDLGETIEYYDDEGNLIRETTRAKPIVVTYTDQDPITGADDTWAAISRDDGETWKRTNLSRTADLSSFTDQYGLVHYGDTKKPVFMVQSNKMMVAWSSKYARGGKPRYAIDTEDDYPYDDAYAVDDIWGVGGPQRSHNYVEDGYPEVGEVPYSVLWTCRGVIASQADVDKGVGEFVGDIVWFKPERVTSGRRDVNQIFLACASGVGFGMVWQEDPDGLRPGRAVGPGPGWGGATTAHKTDIWYSWISWGDHTKVDVNFVPGSDVEHPADWETNRPKWLVPQSLPVRISDNDVVNARNLGIDLTTSADAITYDEANLTRCVKFEGGKRIVEKTSTEIADYYALPDLESDLLQIDHDPAMNCTNCHVPYGLDPMGAIPTQGSPIPLQVIDAETREFLGGFTNGDCVSCHFSNIVPRDRLIAVTGATLDDRCADCVGKGGIWMDGTQEGGKVIEGYYPYEPYPYIPDASDDFDGTHNYALYVDGLLGNTVGEDGTVTPVTDPEFYTFTNNSGAETSVAVTMDGRLLDGDTGASRPNLFLQGYDANRDGKNEGAWAIITYEETKGAGSGPPDDLGEGETNSDAYVPEEGKNVIYHSFDFKKPDLVSAGDIMNTPERDADGNLVYLVDEYGTPILDWQGNQVLAYENARRGRFILQGWGAVRGSRSIMLMVYKMGMEGSGRPSDIMMQRWVIPSEEIDFKRDSSGKITGVNWVEGNPYRFENIVGTRAFDELSQSWYWVDGPLNMSSTTPTVTTASLGDPEVEDAYGAVKVVEWEQTVENLNDPTWLNPYDDGRAHRGQIRGDFVQLGFSYTPNWAAARNGHDHFDFFIRRSFNGGATWTTKPASQGGEGVEHCQLFHELDEDGNLIQDKAREVCTFYPAGAHETMRNLSKLPNHKASVIEPRIVAPPGTIKVDGVWTGIPEDKQNINVFYVAYGTSTNPVKDPETGEQEEPTPADLYWSVSVDKGEEYFEDTWYVNGEPGDGSEYTTGDEVTGWAWMAKGDQEQGEVQLRETPDGSRFYASWLDEGEDGSDIVFRRILPPVFGVNIAPVPVDATAVLEDDGLNDDQYGDDSGGGDE